MGEDQRLFIYTGEVHNLLLPFVSFCFELWQGVSVCVCVCVCVCVALLGCPLICWGGGDGCGWASREWDLLLSLGDFSLSSVSYTGGKTCCYWAREYERFDDGTPATGDYVDRYT